MTSQLQSTVDGVKTTVSELTTSVKEVQTQLSALANDMAKVRKMTVELVQNGTSLPSIIDLDEVKDSVVQLKDGPLDEISTELGILKKSLADLKTQISSDGGHSIASLREHIKQDIKDAINELRTKAPVPQADQHIGKDCIDALLTKTSVMPSNENNVEHVRVLYEKLYLTGGVISSVLEYLRFRSKVKILVDFESDGIENLKTKIMDHDGKEKEGSTVVAFADFEEKVVYLGALSSSQRLSMAQLAQKLAQLAISMAFKNGGRPYVAGDEQSKGRFYTILAEAEKKLRDGEDIEQPLPSAATTKEQLAREIYLISSVPMFIAEYGALGGATRIDSLLPSLLEYYKNHVVPKLNEESKQEFGI